MRNDHIDGLVQDCSDPITNALELLLSCTKPSTYNSITKARTAMSLGVYVTDSRSHLQAVYALSYFVYVWLRL